MEILCKNYFWFPKPLNGTFLGSGRCILRNLDFRVKKVEISGPLWCVLYTVALKIVQYLLQIRSIGKLYKFQAVCNQQITSFL